MKKRRPNPLLRVTCSKDCRPCPSSHKPPLPRASQVVDGAWRRHGSSLTLRLTLGSWCCCHWAFFGLVSPESPTTSPAQSLQVVSDTWTSGLQFVSDKWRSLFAGADGFSGPQHLMHADATIGRPDAIFLASPISRFGESSAIAFGDRVKVTFFESLGVALGDEGDADRILSSPPFSRAWTCPESMSSMRMAA